MLLSKHWEHRTLTTNKKGKQQAQFGLDVTCQFVQFHAELILQLSFTENPLEIGYSVFLAIGIAMRIW